MIKIGRNIRKIRELRNFKQEYMAEQLNISQPTYFRIESDFSKKIDINMLVKIAKVLDVDIKCIIFFDNKTFLEKNSDHKNEINNSDQDNIIEFIDFIIAQNEKFKIILKNFNK